MQHFRWILAAAMTVAFLGLASCGGGSSGTSCADPDRDGLCGESLVCGDTSSMGGTDIPCTCGDLVTTDTTLNTGSDRVLTTACPAGGLTLAAGVTLDLNGGSLAGAGTGNGLTVPAGASALNGTVNGFGVGVSVVDGTGTTSLSDLVVEANIDDGVRVEVLDPLGRVTLDTLDISGNGGHGLYARSAPGASNLEAVSLVLGTTGYGLYVQSSNIFGNVGDGIRLGAADQPADLSALVGGPTLVNEIYGNGGDGIALLQATALAPGDDCGVSAAQPGCSGATIRNNNVHDNFESGVELRSGFLLPLDSSGLGFSQNVVRHNAMSAAGCVATQGAPQVFITGPVGLDDSTCAAAGTEPACTSLNTGGTNNHCVWTAAAVCTVAWDLRGSVAGAGCPGNTITGYNNSGAGGLDVGIRAEGAAAVDARYNSWFSAPKSSVEAGSTISTDTSCAAVGCGS